MLTNTKTILNIKMDKKLKESAQKIAQDIGLPLSTILNSFLKQFVADKEVTFSAKEYRMTSYLEGIIGESREEYKRGNMSGPFKSAKGFTKHLKSK